MAANILRGLINTAYQAHARSPEARAVWSMKVHFIQQHTTSLKHGYIRGHYHKFRTVQWALFFALSLYHWSKPRNQCYLCYEASSTWISLHYPASLNLTKAIQLSEAECKLSKLTKVFLICTWACSHKRGGVCCMQPNANMDWAVQWRRSGMF